MNYEIIAESNQKPIFKKYNRVKNSVIKSLKILTLF